MDPSASSTVSQPRSGRRSDSPRAGTLEPSTVYIGPVAIWFLPKPRGPRFSLRHCAAAWLILLPLAAANALWVQMESDTWWPFGRRVAHMSEVLLRYELIILVGLAYLTLISLPIWLRYRQLARRDARDLNHAIENQQWERAGLLLHRYCLLFSAIWRKLPAAVAAWDTILRSRLPRHRRIYVYYRGDPPVLPQDATSGFAITIVRPPRPSPWSAAALVPIALMLYLLLADVVRHGDPHQAFLFNTVLLGVLLVSYTAYFFTALLGRSNFLRFAPGLMQVVKYRALRRKPQIQEFGLRSLDIAIDLSSPWPGLSLLKPSNARPDVFRLPRDGEALDAVFRASLSTATITQLPDDLLVD